MNLKRKKKLIVIKPNGNHSNRLQQNLHFEVFCKEHDIEYHNPTLNNIADLYTQPCNTETNLFLKFLQIDLLGKLFRHSRVVKKIFSVVWIISKLSPLKLVRFDKESEISNSEELLLNAFKKNDVVYVAGWRFRLTELSKKYWAEMSKKYTIKASIYEKNLLVNRVNDLLSNGYVLVGIHIRRGDYIKWKNGIYCFNDSVYKKYMDSVSEQLSNNDNEKHVFILFSNENIDFQQTNKVIISKETWYIDHHIMSLCHYLIGPPSTFTLWASYIGQGKLIHLYDSNDNIKI